MSIQGELKKLGYEFDHEYGDSEERGEVWVNRGAGMGVADHGTHATDKIGHRLADGNPSYRLQMSFGAIPPIRAFGTSHS